MKRRDNTFHTPLVPPLNELGFPPIPKKSDKVKQLLQELGTVGSCWNRPGPWWGGYNPEKYLSRWAAILSTRDDLLFDVIGWAFYAAQCEAEHKKQRKLTTYDFLRAQKPRALLSRLAGWADARLRYHRVGLRLTFYKRDVLAGQEPIASNVEWLRQRLKHFVAVRTKEIQPEPYLNPKHYHSSSELDYLCWLHLISPISERWTRHEISKAAKKTFFDQSYLQFKETWWRNKTREDQSLKDQSLEEHLLKKSPVAVEFGEAAADWLSGVLVHLRPFSDSLADLLRDTGFRYTRRRGRAPKPRTETPSEPDKSTLCKTRSYPDTAIEAIAAVSPQLATIVQSTQPLENFEMLGKKDLEKDEPKGWLLAKAITV